MNNVLRAGRVLAATGAFMVFTAAPAWAGGSISWGPLAACGGSLFETCASVSLSSSVNGDGNTVIDLTITNMGSSGEVFAAVGLMGLPAGGAGVQYTSGPSGWTAPANELGGDGLIEVVYGARAPNPRPHNGLGPGESGTFTFTFDRQLSDTELNALGGAVHAISGPGECSTKLGVTQNGAVREGPYDPACDPTVVPEPMTMVLLGTGLAGVAGVARRRRRQDEVETEEVA